MISCVPRSRTGETKYCVTVTVRVCMIPVHGFTSTNVSVNCRTVGGPADAATAPMSAADVTASSANSAFMGSPFPWPVLKRISSRILLRNSAKVTTDRRCQTQPDLRPRSIVRLGQRSGMSPEPARPFAVAGSTIASHAEVVADHGRSRPGVRSGRGWLACRSGRRRGQQGRTLRASTRRLSKDVRRGRDGRRAHWRA